MLQCLAVESVAFGFEDSLHDIAVPVLHQFAVQTDPEGLVRRVAVGGIPCFRFRLGDTLIVVAGRVEHQILAGILAHFLGHDRRVEHHRQNGFIVLHSGFPACLHKPLLAELRQELVLGIMMMDAIGEPDTFEIPLESLPLGRLTSGFRLPAIKSFQSSSDTEVVRAILIIEDVASPEGCLAQIIHQSLLLHRQALKIRHAVTQYRQIVESVHHILKILFGLRLRLCRFAAAAHQRCQSNKKENDFFHIFRIAPKRFLLTL